MKREEKKHSQHKRKMKIRMLIRLKKDEAV